MKKNKKSLLLATFLITCTHSVFTIKKDRLHKAPDLRSQKNSSLQTARYTEKIAAPSYRDWKRHFHAPQIELTGKQRLLFSACMLTLLGQSVIGCLPPQGQTSQVKDIIYSETYYPPTRWSRSSEEKTFGSCEKLPDNATLCRAIGSNYTVTSCIHPSESEWQQAKNNCCPNDGLCKKDCLPVSRCLSYSFNGMAGSESESPKIDLKKAYTEARKVCTEAPRKIAQEIKQILSKPTYQPTLYFPDNSHPNITMPIFGPTASPTLQLSYQDHNKQDYSCFSFGGPVEKKDLTTLVSLVETLSEEMTIKGSHVPTIHLYNDEACDPIIKHKVSFGATEISLGYFRRAEIRLMSSVLQRFSDHEIASVIAHELHHHQQRESWQAKTNNNAEAEADLASLLATGTPCFATSLDQKPNLYHRSFPLITSENAPTRLAGQNDEEPHPKDMMRQSLALIMWERDKEATELLMADHEKRKK